MQKVLIANRGEIALRIIRACHEMGLQTVAVHSKADEKALHVINADEAVCIGPAPSKLSYLSIPNILAACEVTHADAVHPGYGFLSENANFASICESSGINFIGPSSKNIQLLGDKAQAKATAKKAGCPVIPGSDGVVKDPDHALEVAKEIGFPVFIKASAGGGGKGIRIAYGEDEFKRLYLAASSEAEMSFSNPDIYLEKMIVNPRHIEIQVAGDKHGHYLHFGERDCSIQRRRQKLIEEAPSPYLDEKLRKAMGEAAVAIVKKAKYHSVGTVEFLVDKDHNFYFMEVNTRLQVEHTVTEEVTGIDLVKLQIDIANGKKLPCKQSEVTVKGHSIQFRINAEDPSNNFAPSPGNIDYCIFPGGPNVRIDSAVYSGSQIPPFYDSMIAKLIINGKTRQEAIMNAKRALREFYIEGVHSTLDFHRAIMDNSQFNKGDYDLNFTDDLLASGLMTSVSRP